MLTRGCDLEELLAAWHFGDWNEFRVRCVGRAPRVTVWINDLLVAEIDLATLAAPHYDADAVSRALGRSGHLVLEVHDIDVLLGYDRWGPDARCRCRWRKLRIREL
jgi:hypothetical protein